MNSKFHWHYVSVWSIVFKQVLYTHAYTAHSSNETVILSVYSMGGNANAVDKNLVKITPEKHCSKTLYLTAFVPRFPSVKSFCRLSDV